MTLPKTYYIIFSIFLLSILVSCSELADRNESIVFNEIRIEGSPSIKINYDFDKLRLHLNTSIDDPTSKVEWRWDYLNSDNGAPDTIGIDHYMNLSQSLFSYNDETTLPSLSVSTDRNKIKRFSSTIIFNLEDRNSASINNLLDSLSIMDLLKEDKVRHSIIDNHKYQASYDNYEESIELKLSEEEYGYDRITYEIKMRSNNNSGI